MKYQHLSFGCPATSEALSEGTRSIVMLPFKNRESVSRIPANRPPGLTSALTRAYFRSIRAAEMAAWEITGGDYLLKRRCS
jgi:hypothetical protein